MSVRLLMSGSSADTTPDQFTFTDVSGINPSTVTTSGTVTVTGLSPNISIVVTASGGTVDAGTSALSGTFASSKTVTTSATGTFVMAAQVTSSASFSTAVNCVVTINGISDTFTVTTRAIDTTPNQFTFTDTSGANLNTVYSTSVVPTGYDSASWTVTGGTASTDNATWTTSGSITSGQTFYIRGTSSGSYSTAVNIVATIGGVTDTYTITTRATDYQPNTFQLTNVTGATLSTVYTSNSLTLSGMDPNISVTVNGRYSGLGTATVDAGTSSLSGTFATSKLVTTSASGTIIIQARNTSSASYSTAVNAYLSVGDEASGFVTTSSWSITTAAVDTTPNAFTFSDVTNAELSTVYTSNTVTVTGMSPNISVTVTASGGTVDAGTSSLSGTFNASKTVTTSASGTIVVATRITSSSSNSTSVNSTITIGGVSDVYTVTTKALPTDALYTTAGTYSWTAPAGVTSVCVVCVGGGGGCLFGGSGSQWYSGGGGGLRYRNSIAVSPGTAYTVVVGGGGGYGDFNGNWYPTDGGISYFKDTSTVYAAGGSYAVTGGGGSPATGGNGGSGSSSPRGGGGGAGGYSGAGGNAGGGGQTGSSGAGGGGGGGGGALYNYAGGGGGVGLYGQGTNGAGGAAGGTGSPGGGGSSGASGSGYNGGTYGGGGGSGQIGAGVTTGGRGAVRIMWGAGKSFPNNAA